MQPCGVTCNKKAHPGMNALRVSVIRLRRTGKACAPKEHLSVCASGAFESEVKSV